MITNASGFVVKDFYYDPWGASSMPNNNITQWIAEQPFKMLSGTITTLGFTGHEHLDEVGLIHMNGRIYDAKIARFVQADPIIQDPLRVQSLNRYSYVWNNPLNATDPSGFQTRSQISGDSDDDWAEDPMDAWQRWWDSQAGEDCSASCRNNLRDCSSGGGGLAELIHNAMNGSVSSNSYWTVIAAGNGSTEGSNKVSYKALIRWNVRGGQEGRNTEMMAALKPFVESDGYIGFWETAKGYGDPLAQLALDFHGSLYGDSFGTRVAISKLELAYSGDERLSPELLLALKSTVGRGLMIRHYDALRTDINRSIGTPGVLSVRQIDQYHYSYFESIGLPQRTYGGRGVPGIFYYSSCDPVSN